MMSEHGPASQADGSRPLGPARVPPPKVLLPGDSSMRFYDPTRDHWPEAFQTFHDARVANPRPLGDPSAAGDRRRPGRAAARVSAEVSAPLRAERRTQLADLVSLSSHSRLIWDPTSGHDIPADDPSLIAALIREVVLTTMGLEPNEAGSACARPDDATMIYSKRRPAASTMRRDRTRPPGRAAKTGRGPGSSGSDETSVRRCRRYRSGASRKPFVIR